MRQCWLCLALLLGPAASAPAEDSRFPLVVVPDTNGETDRYCGLYCVYQAGRMTGRNVDLDRLIRPGRLRGEFGSTATDLVECCREFGIRSTYLPNASYTDVWLLGGPVIVLVKSSPASQKANHWVMVLSADADSARVYDPSAGVIQISAAELQSLWGGPALVILDDADGPEVVIAWATTKIALFALACGLTVLVLQLLRRTRLPAWAILVVASVGLAVVAHVTDPAGFANNTRVIRQIDSVRHPRVPGQMAPQELNQCGTEVLLVDSRTAPQFQHARIPGAVNIPITASYWRNKQALASVPRTTRVVVYCNSKSCSWARVQAASLLFEDFDSVCVLEGGIESFEAAGGKLEYGRIPGNGAQ